MAGYGREGAAFAVVLFEHIGLIGAIGLSCRLEPERDEETKAAIESNVSAVADGPCALIANHGGSASPWLDAQVIDITLALMFLVLAGRRDAARN